MISASIARYPTVANVRGGSFEFAVQEGQLGIPPRRWPSALKELAYLGDDPQLRDGPERVVVEEVL